MKFSYLLLALALVALGASVAVAVDIAPVTPLPAGTHIQKVTRSGPPTVECGIIYSNTTTSQGYYYGAGAGIEVADDLHMISAGHLCAIDMAYYATTATNATVIFYANDPVDDPPGVVLAGPYLLSGLPAGAYVVNVPLEPGTGPPDVSPDIWLGVTFDTDGAGLILMHPPTIGTSDDLFFETPPGAYYWFGGNPVANFGLGVYASIVTPAHPSTWGSIKQLYR
jgi:hypothetical protein